MQILSKTKALYVVVVIISLFGITLFYNSNIALAQTSNQGNTVQKDNESQDLFCSKFGTIKDDLSSQIEQKAKLLKSQKDKENSNIKDIFIAKDKELKDIRNAWDSNRQDQIDKLKYKYRNDKQKKAAIEKFSMQVDQAINDRRKKTDEITKLYRQETQNNVKDNGTKLEEAIKNYQQNFINAQNDATSSCLSGQASQTVKSQFQSNLQLSKNELLSSNGGVSDYYSSLKSSTTKRKSELTQVKSVFIAAVESASNQLKLALQE